MDVPGLVAAAINAWLAGVAGAILAPALQTAAQLVVATPQLDGMPAVVSSWRLAQATANAVLVLAVAACGVLVMSGAGDGRFTVKVLLPRLALAALGANLSLAACGALIAFDNALVAAVLAPAAERAALLVGSVTLPASPQDVLGVLAALAAGVLAVVLVGVAVIRDLVLMVATALAPLALATYALPQSEAIARTWIRVYVALLFVQVVQVAALEVGSAVIPGDQGLFPASALVSGVLAVTLVYLLARLPLVAIDVALRPSGTAVPVLQPVLVGLRALRG